MSTFDPTSKSLGPAVIVVVGGIGVGAAVIGGSYIPRDLLDALYHHPTPAALEATLPASSDDHTHDGEQNNSPAVQLRATAVTTASVIATVSIPFSSRRQSHRQSHRQSLVGNAQWALSC